ncbi:MAG: GntR family transcriptional regulator [Gemmataceae bacterium]
MLFDIQPNSAVPIFEQIVAQVIYGIASGTLPAGTMIPSVRELAEKILVHPNTVSKAFQELERRGVIIARRGKGMEVTAEGPEICCKQRQEILRKRIRDVLREAALALPHEQLRELVEEEFQHIQEQTQVNGKT